MSVLNKTVSYYINHVTTEKGSEVNLLKLLTSNRHKAIIERLRNEPDEIKQKAIKNALACFTVAGVFNKRTKAGLIIPSGLACVDLDAAEDFDLPCLLTELRKIQYIAYAGLSCRGQRLFLIVPFATSEYDRHYDRLIQSFIDIGLPMGDKCHRNLSQPRYVSYNDENTHWFNHNAKPYNLLAVKRTYSSPLLRNNSLTANNAFNWCVEQVNKSQNFHKGNRHNYILRLARYCNLKGLVEHTALTGCLAFARPDFTELEIGKIVTYVYEHHKDSNGQYSFKNNYSLK